MASRPKGTSADAEQRPGRSGSRLFGGAGGVWAFVGGLSHVRSALVVAVALVVGLVLAPQWAVRKVPTDPALVGTPATGDIKAEYDDRGNIVDEATTAQMRDQVVDDVRSVYDYDTSLGRQLAESARRTFDAIAESEIVVAGPTPAGAPRIGLEVSAMQAVFDEGLGVRIERAEVAALRRQGHAHETGALLARLLVEVHNRPLLPAPARAALGGEKSAGIVVRRVPDDGTPRRVIASLNTVATVQSARSAMLSRVRELSAVVDGERRTSQELLQGTGVVSDDGANAAQPDELEAKAPAGKLAWRPTPESLWPVVAHLGSAMVKPTLKYSRRATELARADAMLSVPPVRITVKRGEMVIRDGEVFTERHLIILRAMANYGMHTSLIMVGFGAVLLILVLSLAGLAFGGYANARDKLPVRDAAFLALLFVTSLVVARLWLMLSGPLMDAYTWVPKEAFLFAMPVAAAAMIVRLILRTEVALAFAVVGSVALGLMTEGERLVVPFALVGAVLGAISIGTISSRVDLLRAGVRVGAGQAVTALAALLFSADGVLLDYFFVVPAAFAGGILSAFLALAITPVAEGAFGYVSDLKLLELANLNHPALKELIVQAPGTYHHSIIVGSLVEAAAEDIGANPLLAKVMAYYHDLGKGCNALYFIENQRVAGNPHDKLRPSMSAMVIKRHVSDGLEIAKRYGLGEQILAGIAEHHGTTLIQYFYAKAVEQQKEDVDNAVQESEFRYPGRKPQSKETALVMLADSVEAASRSLADPTSARLKGLVNKIINVKFTDGQLEECDLTLNDLHKIAKAFMSILDSIYHSRVEYPDLAPAEQSRDGDRVQVAPAPGDEGFDGDRPDNIRRLGLK